jgi:acyl-coenzyme A synthetase/AMP-(fatty) acid ligase
LQSLSNIQLTSEQGVQVAPADIEAVLLKHSDVAEAAVIGQPHDLLGEQAKAFVVRKQAEMNDEEAEALKESIRDHVQGSLPETHWLGNRVVFLKSLPRNSGGKLLKRLLKKGEYTVA